jgi:hypothetical protein
MAGVLLRQQEMCFRQHVVSPDIPSPSVTLPPTDVVVMAALRALCAWTRGCSPASSDARIIYDARPGSAQTPFDELCSQIIQDYLAARPADKAQAA